jgi:hypothetical protein
MRNEFKKIMHTRVGIGGIGCPCCNSLFGKDRKKLTKLTRERIKHRDRKELRKYYLR